MKISVINYEIKTIIITNRNQNLHIILSEHVTVLPTVKVQSNPIPENGDTTNFNVQSFTGKQDRVIGDVITKLRGIEVDESSGVIKYNDKSISHYYIDGLDLLEKKYNIANKNIPADMVDQVQVLNNHQGILLFDSLKNSGEPALNIKLKKKVQNRFIGRAHAGSGAAPLLWDNYFTGMRFNKKYQMISSLENNNIGNALSNELPDNISIQKVGESGNKNFREEIINKLAMQVPSISARRYLFNNSNLIHFNVLKVLRNKAQLKTNISYLNDFIANESLTNTTYFLPLLPPINFTEIATGYLNTDKIETNIFYTQNLKKLYIKNSTKIKLDFTKQNEQVITSLPVV